MNYTPIIRQPLVSYYQGLTILTPPPPSSAGVITLALNILERYNLIKEGPTVLANHVMVESFKFGFGYRMNLGDPDFVNITNITKQSCDKGYAATIRTQINESQTYPVDHYTTALLPPTDYGTSHFSVVDKYRNAVALTTSVNHVFGSKLVSLKTGVVFNNQMNDFTVSLNKSNEFGLPPSLANIIEPGKRPLSSMSPTIILMDDNIYIVLGGSGGPTIITSVIQAILQVVSYNRNAGDAVGLPRCHHQLIPNKLNCDSNFPSDIISGLQQKGHVVTTTGSLLPDGQNIGNVQIIVQNGNTLYAASDPRKLGKPAGY